MSIARRCAAVGALAVALVAGDGRRVAAQSVRLSVQVINDSIAAAPSLTVASTGVAPEQLPVSVRLEASRDNTFSAPFFVRTAQRGDTTFTLERLLPERAPVFFRTSLYDRDQRLLSSVTNQFIVRSWVRLAGPGLNPNDPVRTRRPVFVWSPSSLTLPPGPWIFDLSVVLTSTGEVFAFAPGISDTAFVLDQNLEANTSYRWRLRARTLNSTVVEDITVVSNNTFTITSPDQPTATLFYQNFPNPFTGQKPTCFWFDLARRSRVRLTIYDIRMNEVKNIIDGIDFPAGAYGRLGNVALAGCDGRFLWDGTDDRGRVAPPGVYLAVFEGDGKRQSKKIVFQP